MVKRIFIGLGSNLNQPLQQVQLALTELNQLPKTRLLHTSSLYRSTPLDNSSQPDYINAVAELSSELSPFILLEHLQAIEQQHKRVRLQQWGPRTLDLDLLLYANEVITSAKLNVPHPGLTQRDFVLTPLAEIAPCLILPNGQSLTDALTVCPRSASLDKLTLPDFAISTTKKQV